MEDQEVEAIVLRGLVDGLSRITIQKTNNRRGGVRVPHHQVSTGRLPQGACQSVQIPVAVVLNLQARAVGNGLSGLARPLEARAVDMGEARVLQQVRQELRPLDPHGCEWWVVLRDRLLLCVPHEVHQGGLLLGIDSRPGYGRSEDQE